MSEITHFHASTDYDLGDSWNNALRKAYHIGYRQFDKPEYDDIRETVTEWATNNSEGYAVTRMMNDAAIDTAIFGTHAAKDFEAAIDTFFESNDDLDYEEYQRDSVVAEDLWIAFETGAYDALLDKHRPQPKAIKHLLD